MICKYLSVCLMGGSGCETEETTKCDEFERREKISEEPCPIMVTRGYSGEISVCDMVFLKALLPPELQCHQDGKCIRFIFSTVGEVAQKATNGQKVERDELLKIITELKEKLWQKNAAIKI